MVWLLVTVLVVLTLSGSLSFMGGCSEQEFLLAVFPLGTSRAGDGSLPEGQG